MASIYDRTDIYDLLEDETRYNAYKAHWTRIIEGKKVHSVLDISIGTGSVSIPLLDLGISLSGSDLNQNMLDRCGAKISEKGFSPDLKRSDFRDLSCWRNRKFDMVASTGNSLAYVSNRDVSAALRQMDSLANEHGFIYIDTRNWDKIVAERKRFYLYDPFFVDDSRVNLIQVWDYNSDESITFNLLYTFEKDNRIYRREAFEERYIPLSKRVILEMLTELGYRNIKIMNFPAQIPINNVKDADWMTIVAQKE